MKPFADFITCNLNISLKEGRLVFSKIYISRYHLEENAATNVMFPSYHSQLNAQNYSFFLFKKLKL